MVYDVAVSGLGPAGVSFLRSLSADLNVIAFDAAEFPRRKLCAGGLTPKAFNLLNELFPGVGRKVRVETKVFKLFNGRKSVVLEFPDVLTYLTDRTELDEFLFNAIAEGFPSVHTREAVLSVEEEGHVLRIRTAKGTYLTRVLVVADGINSRVARQLNLSRDIGFTLEVDVPGRYGEEVIVDFTDFKWGYYWIFPKGEWVTAGLGEFRRSGSALKEMFVKLNRKHGLPVPSTFHGFPIPSGKRRNDVWRGRTIFLGDAGGLVDPLTGEGIYYAALSGIIAAGAVKKAFETGDFSLLKYYEDKVNELFGSEFFWAKVVGYMFFRAKAFNFFVIERSKEIGLLTANILSGRISYREGVREFLKLIPKSFLRF